MQFNFNNFTVIKPTPVSGRQKATVPLVSITHTGINFNSYILRSFDVVKPFVQIKLDAARGELAFIFSENRLPDSYKLSIPQKGAKFGGHASTTARSAIKFLDEKTDLINTNIYRYKFKAEISESQSALMINLKSPYQKAKRKK